MTFNGRSRSGKTSSHASPVEFSHVLYQRKLGSTNCLRFPQWRQNQINKQDTHTISLDGQNQKLSQLLEPKFLVETIPQAVASSTNIGMNIQPDSPSSEYTGNPYLEKPCLSQLAPGVDGSLDLALTSWYCKDTST